MSLQQEFADAKALHSADELLFLPLIEKFEELKTILQSNFQVKTTSRKWTGFSTCTKGPAILINIDEKVSHETGKYLLIRINGFGYLMGIEQVGEIKDKLFFCDRRRFASEIKNKTLLYSQSGTCFDSHYCLEDKLTCVQFFSDMIKKYKQFLV